MMGKTPAITITRLETQADRDIAFFNMTGWTRPEMEQCRFHSPTGKLQPDPGTPHCSNPAIILLGAKEEFWVCEECARRSELRRFKVRKPR